MIDNRQFERKEHLRWCVESQWGGAWSEDQEQNFPHFQSWFWKGLWYNDIGIPSICVEKIGVLQ